MAPKSRELSGALVAVLVLLLVVVVGAQWASRERPAAAAPAPPSRYPVVYSAAIEYDPATGLYTTPVKFDGQFHYQATLDTGATSLTLHGLGSLLGPARSPLFAQGPIIVGGRLEVGDGARPWPRPGARPRPHGAPGGTWVMADALAWATPAPEPAGPVDKNPGPGAATFGLSRPVVGAPGPPLPRYGARGFALDLRGDAGALTYWLRPEYDPQKALGLAAARRRYQAPLI